MFETDPLSGPLARVSPRDRPIPTPELEEALPVLRVSHDRDFLDRAVTSTIAAEGNGRWIDYAGGYTDMLAQREPAGR